MYINIDGSNKDIKEYINETITSLIGGGAISLSDLGVTASSTELNYCKGVTSNIQTQLNGKAASNHTHSNYITTSASCNKNWNWSGKSGQPLGYGVVPTELICMYITLQIFMLHKQIPGSQERLQELGKLI